jgi:transcriptional regulator with XRE-family HTH domain
MINEEKYREARRILCRRLYDIAQEKGITQDQIAEKTGFARNNVSRMLSGRYSPSLENFIKLADAIVVDVTLLVL